MKIGKLFFLVLILIIGCNHNAEKLSANFEYEIDKLESVEDKRNYLEEIFKTDQDVRDGKKEGDLISKYGHRSKEHMDFIKERWRQDEINLQKIEAYFEKYGYPGKEMGEIATLTPLTVIHHAQDYDSRERNFEIIYEAYLNGVIDDGSFSLYLGRMYQMKNDERLRMGGPYKSEDEINLLIKKLNLEDKRDDVKQRI